jgi:hypothetical protein
MERAAKSKPGRGRLGVGHIALQVKVVADNRVMDTAGIAAFVDKEDNNTVELGVREVVDRQVVEAGEQGVEPAPVAVRWPWAGPVVVPVEVVVEVLEYPAFVQAISSFSVKVRKSPHHPLQSQPKSDGDILSLPNRARVIFDYD